MALQLGALRDALIEAGASSAKASEAAEEVAAYLVQRRRHQAAISTMAPFVGIAIATFMFFLIVWR